MKPVITRGSPFGIWSAIFVVIANMIGTGIFTTTGFLIRDLGSPLAVLAAWFVGGLLALCGALIYSELCAALPRNGGEYQILSRVFHPIVGFIAGWISLVVGFSAPIAASSIAFGRYAGSVFTGFPPIAGALGLIGFLALLHSLNVSVGRKTHNILTAVKVLTILFFIVGGFYFGEPSLAFTPSSVSTVKILFSPSFAIGLIFITFTYSGWNGAAYIAGEIQKPSRTLPISLLAGTGFVVCLYLGLNIAFLSSAPANELAGVIEIGHVAAARLFGDNTGRVLSAVISLALISSVSAMMMAGPRVYQAMGEDYRAISFLGYKAKKGGPVTAVCLQAILSALMVLTSTFEILLTYIGFTLSLCAGLTAIGVFVLRYREPDLPRPYRIWGHPLTTVIFILLSGWMIGHALWERPAVALAGLLTIMAGAVLYFPTSRNLFRAYIKKGDNL